MSEATLAYRRLLERFGKQTEKLGHLHHTGEIRSIVKDGIRTVGSAAVAFGVASALIRILFYNDDPN